MEELGLTGSSIGEGGKSQVTRTKGGGGTVINVRGMISDVVREASEAIEREPPEVSTCCSFLAVATKI